MMTQHIRKPFVGGNWKMNTDAAEGTRLIEGLVSGLGDGLGSSGIEVVVYPPFVYLRDIAARLGASDIALGAQNCYYEPNGAFTGEISTDMLKDCGVSSVLAGHSERRHVLGENDLTVNRKVRAALEAGLGVVLCVGETLEQRESGRTDAINEHQVRAGLEMVAKEQLGSVVIAYEPVWAIGTGKTATPEDAQEAHANIRELIANMYDQRAADALRIVYGGSMKPGNAAELMAMPDIDGGLIGGASLKSDDFLAIVGAGASRAV
ncbi:MAG: triose-phosphate isomerase [Phycisphaerales bacterium]